MVRSKTMTRKMTLEMVGLGCQGKDKIIVYNEIVPIWRNYPIIFRENAKEIPEVLFYIELLPKI